MSRIMRCDECRNENPKWPNHWLHVMPDLYGIAALDLFSPWHNKSYPTLAGDFCSFECLIEAAKCKSMELRKMRENRPAGY